MTEDHLPECPTDWCICSYLRACEERVTERWESLRGLGESYAYKTGSDNGFDAGLNAGLDAAREAIKGVNWFNDEGKMLSAVVATADSIAAIDALRKETND